MTDRPHIEAEALARLFHETYERLAPEHGYRTREASAKPWQQVPKQNQALMIATCRAVLDALSAAGWASSAAVDEAYRAGYRTGMEHAGADPARLARLSEQHERMRLGRSAGGGR